MYLVHTKMQQHKNIFTLLLLWHKYIILKYFKIGITQNKIKNLI